MQRFLIIAIILALMLSCSTSDLNFFTDYYHPLSSRYGPISSSLRSSALTSVRTMFSTGYDCYMRCAFPEDELDPMGCRGRGADTSDPTHININDALADLSLTLVDTLDTLVVMNNLSEFKKAVNDVINHVDIENNDNTAQIFELVIRVVGGLLSAHLFLVDEKHFFEDNIEDDYNDELLDMAQSLVDKLMPAFNSSSGLPHPRVNLCSGINNLHADLPKHSCTAGAGSLTLELAALSRLLSDESYEWHARRAVDVLWSRRNEVTGLVGNVIDVDSLEWQTELSGLGAGMDSFHEYLLKMYMLSPAESFGYSKFSEAYTSIKRYLRRGRIHCNEGLGPSPIYVNARMSDGVTLNTWIDSLQAAFPAVQVLHGDLDEAICHHALFYAVWKKYDFLPERFNWRLKSPEVNFYPLRPEFIESTYFLYRATRNPFYLHVGLDVLSSLNRYAKSECGYATIHDVLDKSLEDRQESFFLSETCKYLYLLFDEDNRLHSHEWRDQHIFTTEGHIFPHGSLRLKNQSYWNEDWSEDCSRRKRSPPLYCDAPRNNIRFGLPLKARYLEQLFNEYSVMFFLESHSGGNETFVLHYFLSDHTLEVRRLKIIDEEAESFRAAERIFNRQSVPKTTTHDVDDVDHGFFPAQRSERTIHFSDIVVGEDIFIRGSGFRVIGCDALTRDYLTLPPTTPTRPPSSRRRLSPPTRWACPPPHDAMGVASIGDPCDTLQNAVRLTPRPMRGRIDLRKFLIFDNQVLRYEAKRLKGTKEEQEVYRINYHLSDDSLSVVLKGKKYLARGRMAKPRPKVDGQPDFYCLDDLYIDSVLVLHGRKFVVVGADRRLLGLMDAGLVTLPLHCELSLRNFFKDEPSPK